MRINNYQYVPPTPEQDARFLHRALLKTLLLMSAGAAVYVLAAVLTFWR